MSKVYEPRKVNELKLDVARRRAGTQGLGYDKVLADVVLLIEELNKMEPERDHELVDHLRRKYGQSAA